MDLQRRRSRSPTPLKNPLIRTDTPHPSNPEDPPENQEDGQDGANEKTVTKVTLQPIRVRSNGPARHTFRSSEIYDTSFKVLLLGDSGVGKTCFLIRFKDRAYLSGAYISTIGIDFRHKIINVGNSKVKLQIWDTAGQERFRSVTQAYYRDADAALLIYDVGKRESFDRTMDWMADVKKFGADGVVFMLIANKSDITSGREVTIEDGRKLAAEHDLPFTETSAKTGLNIDLAFTEISRILIARQEKKPYRPHINISQNFEDECNKKYKCCSS